MVERLSRSIIHTDGYDEFRYKIFGYNGHRKKDKVFISGASYLIFKKKGFDWICIADVFTEESYRRKGYSSSILRVMLLDIKKKFQNDANIYLLVDRENTSAIRMYIDLHFEIRFVIKNENCEYLVMTCSTHRSLDQLKSTDLIDLYEES